MFDKRQLELLEDILDAMSHGETPVIGAGDLKTLQGLVRAALWALPRTIPRKDKAAIAAAEAAGLVQIVGRNTAPSDEFKVKIAGPPKKIEDPDELLKELGL